MKISKLQLAAVGLLLLVSTPLWAYLKGSIPLRNATTRVVDQYNAQTLSGIEYPEKGNVIDRIWIWEVSAVCFTEQELDEFNSLPNKLALARGDKLEGDAKYFIELAGNKEKLAKATEDERTWIKLASMYYLARGMALQGKYGDAATAYLDYMKEAEKYAGVMKAGTQGYPKYTLNGKCAFDSPTGAKVADAGLLHWLYLDALEGLGQAYASDGKADKANADGYDRLVALTNELFKFSSRKEFFDWSLRALHASADLYDAKREYAKAREAYIKLQTIAQTKFGNRTNHDYVEAELNGNFVLVKVNTREALNQAYAYFRQAVSTWETSRKSAFAPAPTWISADTAYQVAGSYYGLGLVQSARAGLQGGNATVDDWASALTYYGNALGMFNVGDEMRARCLVRAAEAAAKMGKLRKDGKKVDVALRHADTADTYLTELGENLAGTEAAQDPDVAAIRKLLEQIRKK